MAEAAADAIGLADALGWDRFSLVGHSMSGVAIQHVLYQAPHRVRRLVGVAPVPATGLPLGESEWSLFASAAASPASRAMIVNHATGSRLPAGFIDLIVRHSLDNSNSQPRSASTCTPGPAPTSSPGSRATRSRSRSSPASTTRPSPPSSWSRPGCRSTRTPS